MDSNFLHGPFWYDASDHLRLPPGEAAPIPPGTCDVLCNLSHYRPATTPGFTSKTDFGSPTPHGRGTSSPADFAFGYGDPQQLELEMSRAQNAINSLHADNDAEFESYRLEDFMPDFDPEWRPAA